MNCSNKKVIVITDGDFIARKAVETAAYNVGARCISMSAGNPTAVTYDQLLALINDSDSDLIVCMVDDRGNAHEGKGETILEQLVLKKDVEVLGVVAVASNTQGVSGVKPDFSITNSNHIVDCSVNKQGEPLGDMIYGDTVDVLKRLNVPVIVGIGDPGKMMDCDKVSIGAPITTSALKAIIKHSRETH